jgi:4-hydroxy-4-methyl-2-oxoglutarate aldolase
MSTPTPDLISRYEKLSTPLVYDILDKMGRPNQALDCHIRPIDPGMRVVGPAFTVHGEEDPTDDGSAGYRMFREIVPGSVLVMASNGHRVSGPWGENASISAQMKGARGLVTDGGSRDAAEVAALGFPLFCRYLTPVFMGGRWAVKGHQRPVDLTGQVGDRVAVRPGDLVVADRDGVVIVPTERLDDVLIAAERLNEIEERLRAGLRAGEDREDVYKRHPKFAHVRKPAY